jgi:hypothetical protein
MRKVPRTQMDAPLNMCVQIKCLSYREHIRHGVVE